MRLLSPTIITTSRHQEAHNEATSSLLADVETVEKQEAIPKCLFVTAITALSLFLLKQLFGLNSSILLTLIKGTIVHEKTCCIMKIWLLWFEVIQVFIVFFSCSSIPPIPYSFPSSILLSLLPPFCPLSFISKSEALQRISIGRGVISRHPLLVHKVSSSIS